MFPGDRRVWWAGAAATGVLLAVLATALLVPREYFTGTNSIRVRSIVHELQPGSTLCIPDVHVPAGTGRVEIAVAPGVAIPALEVEFLQGGGPRIMGRSTALAPGPGAVPVSIGEQPEPLIGQLCATPKGAPLVVGGMLGLQSDMRAPTVDGRRLDARVGLWFRPPAGERKSLAALLPDAFERAAVFRPGWVGPWTYWLLFLAGVPLLLYAVLRLLARAFAGDLRRGALKIGLVAFAAAGSWSLLTPIFDTPDEPDHFAYTQVLAETGERPAPYGSDLSAFSQEQIVAIDGLRLYSQIEHPSGRPPWTERDEANWERRVRELGGPPLERDDGGGITTAASHAPAYYGVAAAAYSLAGEKASPWTEVWLARLASVLFCALAAAFSYLFVRELLPGRQGAAVAGGLLVAMFPMFTFISGGVNNDNGVNAAAALTLWLAARALRRGFTWQTALALGAALAILPLFKKTGFALYPAVGLAVAGALWRLAFDAGPRTRSPERPDSRSRIDALAMTVAPALALLAGFVGARAVWAVTGGAIDPAVPAPPGPVEVTGVGTVTAALNDLNLYASYLWQTFLPRMPFMNDLWTAQWPAFDIYIKRGWGAFGWYAITWPGWVYKLFVVVLAAVVAVALAGVWRARAALRTRWIEVGVVVLAVVGVLAAVSAAFVSPIKRPPFLTPEQGRYAFTCMAAFAAVAAWAIATRSKRTAPVLATILVTGMLGLLVGSQLLAIRGFFT